MLQLSSVTTMNRTRAPRAPRNSTSTPSRGGIRKRGAALRTDRDGDLDMDGGSSGRGRGGRGRGRGDRGQNDSGRGTPTSNHSQPRDSRRHGGDKDKTLDAIQKAIYSSQSSQANIRQPRGRIEELTRDTGSRDRNGLEQISVRGWKQSKAASNADGGIESLIAFMEKKGTPPDPNVAANLRVRITKSRVEGDALIISVRPDHKDGILHLNGFGFAGSTLVVEEYKGGRRGTRPTSGRQHESIPNGSAPSQAALDTKTRMMTFLSKRYREPVKVLDLSALASDSDLVEMGMFSQTTTESKFFPALMKVCESSFLPTVKKEEAVTGVSLANNQLINVSFVTTLSQTFPDLKNLDLSNNKIKDIQSLVAWRWKFRNLEFLDLSGNPISAEADFKETMLKWYPKLTALNNTIVRTAEDIAAQKKTPIPILAASFQDESQIAENFVRAFFVGYDNNRDDLVNGVYDDKSTFSLNINTTAPRAEGSEAPAGWDNYIKKSRNLLKINHLPARVSRTYTGPQRIRELWAILPKTKHPDILTQPAEWLIECHPMPGLPDPSGNSETGVGGLLIMVHGKFDELAMPGESKIQTRSFDRTFVLGPGGGLGGLRVVTDMLCLRAYGGSQAWLPEQEQLVVQPQVAQPQPAQPPPVIPPIVKGAAIPPQGVPPHPEAKEGYGAPAPGKTAEQVQREQMTLDISFRTRMTLEFSEMALSGNGWNLDAALKNFEELKTQGKLPTDAFLPIA